MPRDTIEIGTTPAEENCAQTGKTQGSTHFSRLECHAYIQALTRVYGVPPEGSRYSVRAAAHDFGSYREVAFRYDPEIRAHAEYADKIENGLAKWQEAEMWAPVMYQNAQPIHVIEDLDQLDRDANPQAKDARGVARPRVLADA